MLFLRCHPDTSGSVAAPTRPDYWDCRGGMHGWEQDAVDPQQPSRAADLHHTRPVPASRCSEREWSPYYFCRPRYRSAQTLRAAHSPEWPLLRATAGKPAHRPASIHEDTFASEPIGVDLTAGRAPTLRPQGWSNPQHRALQPYNRPFAF